MERAASPPAVARGAACTGRRGRGAGQGTFHRAGRGGGGGAAAASARHGKWFLVLLFLLNDLLRPEVEAYSIQHPERQPLVLWWIFRQS